MTDIKLHISDLNATQLARLWSTLGELGRNDEAAAVREEGNANCGKLEFSRECYLAKYGYDLVIEASEAQA